MRFGRYTFTCVLETPALLPEFKGSAFRGLFGHALKKVVCALKQESCSSCLVAIRCIYALTFESHPLTAKGEVTTRIAARPQPYVIEPDPSFQTVYQAGETFGFHLLLFGNANDFLPYFVYAFDKIGQMGIGRHIEGKRATFSLTQVRSGNAVVYSKETGRLLEGTFTEEIHPLTTDAAGSVHKADAMEIRLKTPLRLKYENHLEASLPFHLLIRAALRRLSALENAYGAGEPSLDYRGLVARAREVKMESSSLRWFDWRRYSNRQDQAMLMGGMIGKISYRGDDLTEYIPILQYCEKVHLGKQTTFGLGHFSLHVP
jgi:hypothetical protein